MDPMDSMDSRESSSSDSSFLGDVMNLPLNSTLGHCASLYNEQGGEAVPAWVNRYTIQSAVTICMILFQYILRVMAEEGNKEAAEVRRFPPPSSLPPPPSF